MIISHKHQFLFIGLPFSASSAISKDLYLNYEGTPFLRKHSLYHDFISLATKEERQYFTFAVLRNPMDIVVTVYEKMRANAKGNFTNSDLFIENGGHITKKQRDVFRFINEKNATFQQYFRHFYKKPYDNLASITIPYCDYVIRYENIKDDYLTALRKTGIKTPKLLPIANQTLGKGRELLDYYTDEIKDQSIFVFAPFLSKHNYSFPQEWGRIQPSLQSKIQFNVLGFCRNFNQKYLKKRPKKISKEGSIYGDMQRKKLKQD